MSASKGFVQVLVLVLLLAGIASGAYLVQNKTFFAPKANQSIPISGPIGYFQPKPISQPITPPITSPTPFVCSACAADINKNGRVDAPDYARLAVCWGAKAAGTRFGQSCASADINGNGRIDAPDYFCLQSKYNQRCVTPTPIISPLPKPSSYPTSILVTPTPKPSPVSKPTPTPSISIAKRVFVTSTTYNGNLGGLGGADVKCQIAANNAQLGGTWRAWISDNSTSASARLAHSHVQYKLLDGTIIAYKFDDFINSNIPARINITENKTIKTTFVWTNTKRDGTIASQSNSFQNGGHCINWTSTTDSLSILGVIGNSDGLLWQSRWTWDGSQTCGQQAALYCFEQ